MVGNASLGAEAFESVTALHFCNIAMNLGDATALMTQRPFRVCELGQDVTHCAITNVNVDHSLTVKFRTYQVFLV